MTATDLNRETVERRLARLCEEYDPIIEENHEIVASENFEEFTEIAAEGYTGGGYAWVIRERPKALSESMPDVDEQYPRVLLGLGRGDDGWGPTGGGRKSGETYEEAAVREVQEETGIGCEIVDCRRVNAIVLEREDTDDTAHTLWVYFVARAVGGALDVMESELNGAAWFHDLPPNLHRSVADHPWSWDEWP